LPAPRACTGFPIGERGQPQGIPDREVLALAAGAESNSRRLGWIFCHQKLTNNGAGHGLAVVMRWITIRFRNSASDRSDGKSRSANWQRLADLLHVRLEDAALSAKSSTESALGFGERESLKQFQMKRREIQLPMKPPRGRRQRAWPIVESA